MQPLRKGRVFGYENSVLNLALRLEYGDWNRDHFAETSEVMGDDIWAVVLALSWQPSALTVGRLNDRHQWGGDFLSNPPARSAAVQLGLSAYF